MGRDHEPPRPVGVVVREFTPADRQACLEVFMSNVPRYFTPQERHEFEAFLDALPGPYLVLVDHVGEVVGCGGYALNEDGLVADLCWGMVGRGLHGTGLGRTLTQSRLDRVRAHERVKEIALNTSQHTTGFYERMGFRTVEVVKDGYEPGLDRCEMRYSVGGETRSPSSGPS